MIEKLVDKNINFLQKHLICDEDRIEVFKYSLRIVYSFIIDVIALLFLAAITHKILETVIIMIAYAVLQVYGGGFHAETQIRCFVISLLGWFIGVFGIERIVSIYPFVGIIAMVVFTAIVLIYTPALNDKHPVGGKVYKRSKKIARITMLILNVILVFSMVFKHSLLFSSLSVMQILSSISIISAVIKRHIKQNKTVV